MVSERWDGVKGIKKGLNNYEEMTSKLAQKLSQVANQFLEGKVIIFREFYSDSDFSIEIISVPTEDFNELNEPEIIMNKKMYEAIVYETQTGEIRYFNPKNNGFQIIDTLSETTEHTRS